jgi:uncharacterized membrane protein YdcZ (DUF606 family)
MPPAISLIGLVIVCWVAYDATQRDWSGSSFADAAWKWIVGTILLWFIVLPIYLVKRRSAPLKA